jgi:hypothetical protein
MPELPLLPPELPLPMPELPLLPPELPLVPELLRASRMHFSFSEPVMASHFAVLLAPELAPPELPPEVLEPDEPLLPPLELGLAPVLPPELLPELPDDWASVRLAIPSNAAATAAPINFILINISSKDSTGGKDCNLFRANAMPACQGSTSGRACPHYALSGF